MSSSLFFILETFRGCSALRKVTASSNLFGIGRCAFSDCTNLEEISGLSGTITMFEGAFENCAKLTSNNFEHCNGFYFDISGSMSYDNNKSVIYINNITYCGAKDDTRYENITCTLFEKHDSNKKELSICDKKYETTLEEFLKDTTFHVDNTSCKNYSSDHLYLEIYATKTNGEKILYEVPMRIQDSCE